MREGEDDHNDHEQSNRSRSRLFERSKALGADDRPMGDGAYGQRAEDGDHNERHDVEDDDETDDAYGTNVITRDVPVGQREENLTADQFLRRIEVRVHLHRDQTARCEQTRGQPREEDGTMGLATVVLLEGIANQPVSIEGNDADGQRRGVVAEDLNGLARHAQKRADRRMIEKVLRAEEKLRRDGQTRDGIGQGEIQKEDTRSAQREIGSQLLVETVPTLQNDSTDESIADQRE